MHPCTHAHLRISSYMVRQSVEIPNHLEEPRFGEPEFFEYHSAKYIQQFLQRCLGHKTHVGHACFVTLFITIGCVAHTFLPRGNMQHRVFANQCCQLYMRGDICEVVMCKNKSLEVLICAACAQCICAAVLRFAATVGTQIIVTPAII